MERSAEDWFRIGNEQRDAGHGADAADSFEHAVALDPSYAKAWNNLGAVNETLGRHDAALRSYRMALEKDPSLLEAYLNLAHLNASKGRRAAAERWYRAGLERHPDEPNLVHMLNALLGETTSAPPQGHIAALFDGMAQGFDRLLHGLDYRVPEALARLVLPTLQAIPSARVIDLGCGTGLVGAALQDSGAQVLGIDLSAEMLKRAALGGYYAERIQGDLVGELSRVAPGGAHAILAADVFIYLGDLAAAFEAAARALAPQGMFVFSVEESEQAPFQLLPSGRYAHSVAYLRGLAANHGLLERTMQPFGLRRGDEGYTRGYLACLARPGV